MSDIREGSRVSWMGGVDLGARWVRWFGRVVGLGFGVPSGYERQPDGTLREVLPRRPAARVDIDLPQHGKTRVMEHEEPLIVPLDDLRLEATSAGASGGGSRLSGPLLTYDEAARIALDTGEWPKNVAPGTAGVEPPDPLHRR
jgi:hypothetical protein